jgi:hypothetical protein
MNSEWRHCHGCHRFERGGCNRITCLGARQVACTETIGEVLWIACDGCGGVAGRELGRTKKIHTYANGPRPGTVFCRLCMVPIGDGRRDRMEHERANEDRWHSLGICTQGTDEECRRFTDRAYEMHPDVRRARQMGDVAP